MKDLAITVGVVLVVAFAAIWISNNNTMAAKVVGPKAK